MANNAQHTLMVLGSTDEFIKLVKCAQARGIKVVVCDGFEDGPAKKVADVARLADVRDTGAVVQVAREEGVDGIITAFSDFLAERASIIAKAAGLPFYITPERLATLRDKTSMKAMFDQLGIAYPKTVVVHRDTFAADIAPLSFPVVTKPIDGWGSRGVYMLETPAQVQVRFEEIAGYSSSDAIIVEEYNSGFELNTMSWVVDGKPVILEIADREKSRDPKLPTAIPHVSRICYPSVLLDQVRNDIQTILDKVAAYVGIQNGPLCMQCFYKLGQGIEVCECAGRIFGTEHDMLEYGTYGKLTIEDLLIDCVYEPARTKERLANHDPHLERYSAGLFFQAYEGSTIATFDGVAQPGEVEGVVNTLQYFQPGDKYSHSIAGKPYLLTIYICANTRAELDQITDKIVDMLHVTDAAGNNLVYHNERSDYAAVLGE